MQLDSYLEIFTTMYGWAFANIIGEVIVGTGLVILPFALIVFNAWREAKEKGLHSAGVLPLLESVQVQLIVALFVMSVCFATTPMTSLNSINLYYTPPATVIEASPADGSRDGGTQSGYDTAMKDATDGSMSDTGNLAYVPAWWFTMMAISSGTNNAVRNGLKNNGGDVRLIEDMARSATIEDPALRSNIQRFYSECFVPARSKYLTMDKSALSAAGQAIVKADNKDYGPTDVDWMGSQLFRTEAGFYDGIRSYNPVPGFPIDFARDTDYYNPASTAEAPTVQVNPAWGRPTCKQWWEDSTVGLREQMVKSSSKLEKASTAALSVMKWDTTDQRNDAFAKLVQAKAQPSFVDQDRIMGTEYDNLTTIGRIVGGGVSSIGVAKEAVIASLSMAPLMVGLPMMQALVLMGLYMFLPLIVFLSGFDLKVMFYGAIAIFTVKLWAAMWFIAQWLDARLINAMYPGLQGNVLVQEITHMTHGHLPQGYKRVILNILLVGMFIGLPILWTAMMGWIGLRMGTGLDRVIGGAAKTASSSGSSSASVGRKGVR